MTEERWKHIPEFNTYMVSDQGRIFNKRRETFMSISQTNHGHCKIALVDPWTHERKTRSVAVLVAQAFVEAPEILCDAVILKDGVFTHIHASNLAWRPEWFAWQYARQLRTPQPIFYKNLPVYELVTETEYPSIVDAGMALGLLFDDIWESTYKRSFVWPLGYTFEVMERV